MRKIYIPLFILMGLIYSVYAEDYPYTQNMRHKSKGDYGVHFQAMRDASKNQDMDKLRQLCMGFREQYDEFQDLRQYLILFKYTYTDIDNILRSSDYDGNLYQDVNLIQLTDQALQHVETILDGSKVPPELLPDYCKLRINHLANTYPVSSTESRYAHPRGYTKPIPKQPLDKTGETRRRAITEYNIELLGYLEQATDSRWDPDRSPRIPLPRIPKDGLSVSGGFSGMYIPDYIKDPVLKQKYIEALDKQEKATYWWGAQRDLRIYRRRFDSGIDKKISYMYAQKPDNIAELKQILADNKISPEASERILSTVTEVRNNPSPEPASPNVFQAPTSRPRGEGGTRRRNRNP